MKDTVITTTECFFYDPGGYKNGYPGGSIVLTFHSASGSTLGLSFDSMLLADEADRLNVYDGNSISAPPLTSISRLRGVRSVKSSGGSLTIQLVAYGYGTTDAYGWRAHLYSLVNDPQPAQFTTVMNGLGPGNFDSADYDHDGDADILTNGTVFRNDSKTDSMYGFVKQINSPVGNWNSASMCTADFNDDGYKDAFIIGQYLNIGTAARLYLNDKNGGFILAPQSFVGAFSGSCRVLDYNHDDKPDISYIGSSNLAKTAFVLKLYINNGDGSFTEQNINVPGMSAAALDWADTDNDGDMDLVVNGAQGSASYARFYVNNNHTFTELAIGLTYSCTGQISFTDLNGDGKPDIMNTGITTPDHIDVISTQLLLNSGNNRFTSVTHNLPPMRTTYTAWADYDKDGDADLLMSGTNSLSPAAYVYQNDGNFNFTRIELNAAESYSPVQWLDINKDGKLDVFVVSRDGGPSYIRKNINNDSFAIISYPLPAIQGMGSAVIEDFDNDGLPDILYAGNLSDYDCLGTVSLLIKGLGWRYEKVAILTKVANINESPGSPGFSKPFWKWADFDSDGSMDIIVTNNIIDILGIACKLKIYKNRGNNSFELVYDGQPGGKASPKAAFVDLDNDGKNELVLAPNSVFMWNGTDFILLYGDNSYCCDYFNMSFGDFNKDGYIDMALSKGAVDAFSIYGRVHIYKNNRKGRLIEVDPDITYNNLTFIQWRDMDHDSDLDLVGSNFMLENVDTSYFVYKDIRIPHYWGAAIGDFNGDGSEDLYGLTFRSSIGPTHLYYGQGPNFFYKENTPAGFPINGFGDSDDALALDIDGDEDLDILHSAGYCANGLIINTGNLTKKRIVLTSPNGGEKLSSGSTYTIQWTGGFIGSSVAISYSTDNGRTYNIIEAAAPSGMFSGRYDWTATNIVPSDSCLIKITDNHSVAISNSVFSIDTSSLRPLISRLDAIYCEVRSPQNVYILNLPLPSANIAVSATLDKFQIPVIAGTVNLPNNMLSPGKHLISVTYTKNSVIATTTDSFIVIAAVTPTVKLRANITNIVDLTVPVVVMASALQGGGSLPLFTFALDASFNSVHQAESANAAASINASTFKVGQNHVYVKMKTSDTCYKVQTGVDSVLIIRDVATGIINPDNPTTFVKVHPNPFRQQIFVSGLTPGKTYQLTIRNSYGQSVYETSFRHTNITAIPGLQLRAGIYWVSISDKTAKKNLGAIKLIKL